MKYIYHHLGLGDHISCHGIVRHFSEIEDKICLFIKPHNLDNVKRMFSDINNIDYIVGDDNFVNDYISKNKINNLIKVGFDLNKTDNFEIQFYNMANLPIEFKYTKFHVERNYDKEIEIFNSLSLKKNEYIFVHDGGYEINETLYPKDIQIVKPNGHGLFDWMYVIENAKEIHCIDSSFICLIDCMDLPNIPLNNHRYVRKYPDYIKLYTTKNWKFIEQ